MVVWEGKKAFPVEEPLSLVLYWYLQPVIRPETGLVAMVFGRGFRHKARAPIEHIPPHCKSATNERLDYYSDLVFGYDFTIYP